jgi:hypothetical protein
MTGQLPVLSAASLGALATAIERGLLIAPLEALQIGRHVSKTEQGPALKLVEGLHTAGLYGPQLGEGGDHAVGLHDLGCRRGGHVRVPRNPLLQRTSTSTSQHRTTVLRLCLRRQRAPVGQHL